MLLVLAMLKNYGQVVRRLGIAGSSRCLCFLKHPPACFPGHPGLCRWGMPIRWLLEVTEHMHDKPSSCSCQQTLKLYPAHFKAAGIDVACGISNTAHEHHQWPVHHAAAACPAEHASSACSSCASTTLASQASPKAWHWPPESLLRLGALIFWLLQTARTAATHQPD